MNASPDSPLCELCEASRITPWFHEDDECWVAECEACSVPMVVWKVHDPSPDDATRERLLGHLRRVAAESMGERWWIDEVLRTIPGHFHAHARRRWVP